MKRYISLLLSLSLLCLSLSGCGQTQTGTISPEAADIPKQETAAPETTVSETTPAQEKNNAEASTLESQSATEEYPMTESPSNPELRNLSGEKVNINIGDTSFVVELYDNSAAADLLDKLPLTYTISDYAGYDEKLIRLDSNDGLSMDDYTGGDEPGIPEVGYYEPGNWIALYFGYIGYWSGKIPIGKIQATCEEIEAIPAGSTVTIEQLDD